MTGPPCPRSPWAARRTTTSCPGSIARTSWSASVRPRRVQSIPLEPGRHQADLHIDAQPAEVDASSGRRGADGDIEVAPPPARGNRAPGISGRSGAERHASQETLINADLRQQLLQELGTFEHDDSATVKPQKAILDLRRALSPHDIVVSDVGAHKIWVARLYQAYEPNTVIISNGFASMGIALPGAIAARSCTRSTRGRPVRGRWPLMNVQELETAVRLRAKVTVVVWRDDGYGLIHWKQRNEFGRRFG